MVRPKRDHSRARRGANEYVRHLHLLVREHASRSRLRRTTRPSLPHAPSPPPSHTARQAPRPDLHTQYRHTGPGSDPQRAYGPLADEYLEPPCCAASWRLLALEQGRLCSERAGERRQNYRAGCRAVKSTPTSPRHPDYSYLCTARCDPECGLRARYGHAVRSARVHSR